MHRNAQEHLLKKVIPTQQTVRMALRQRQRTRMEPFLLRSTAQFSCVNKHQLRTFLLTSITLNPYFVSTNRSESCDKLAFHATFPDRWRPSTGEVEYSPVSCRACSPVVMEPHRTVLQTSLSVGSLKAVHYRGVGWERSNTHARTHPHLGLIDARDQLLLCALHSRDCSEVLQSSIDHAQLAW